MTFSSSSNSFVDLTTKIQNMAPAMEGVFGYSDLLNMLPLDAERKIQRIIARLIESGLIRKVKRGVYTNSNPDLWRLASRLCPPAYISTDNVLAKNGLISTIPARRVFAISPLPRTLYELAEGTIEILQIKKELMFGFKVQNGVRIADSEKAFLDLVYFYRRGIRFVANPQEGIDLEKLDSKKISKYLKAYSNKKFVDFIKEILHAKS